VVRFECNFPGCPFKGTNRKDYLLKHMSRDHRNSQPEKVLRERYEDVIRRATPPTDENQRDFDLLEASRAGDERKIRELVAQLPSTSNSETHSQRRTMLHLAAHEGHETLTRVLLARGADTNERSSSGETAFFMAIKAGHTAIVRLFLDKGVSVNEMSEGENLGLSPLAMAAKDGHVEVVKVLIEYGSIPERLSPYSFDTALGRAVRHNQEEIVALLIENGADVNQKVDDRASPCLHRAVEAGRKPNMVKILLEAQADLESRNSTGWTPLYTSLMQEDRGNSEIVSLLVDAGAHVSPRCWERFTPELQERYADRCSTQ
jgi:ankyrin repeat protein